MLQPFVTTTQITAIVLALLAGGLHDTSAQVSFTEMPSRGANYYSSYIRGISDDGATRVGFHSSNQTEAVRWTDGGGVVGLSALYAGYPYSYAHGISADGSVIVGQSLNTNGYYLPVYWNSGGLQQVPLGNMTSGLATDCSADGAVIVGSGSFNDGNRHAFRWHTSTGLVDLGHLPGGTSYSGATAVSDDGSVVIGYSSGYINSTYRYRGFLWTSGSGMVDIGSLPGIEDMIIPMDVSGDGSTIVGYARTANGNRAFRWTTETGVTELEHPTGANSNAVATCTSSDGRISAGRIYENSIYSAAIWTPENGLEKVETLLTNGGVDLTGWQLIVVDAISNDGSIIGGHGINPSGRNSAWMATLFTPTSSTLVSLPGAVEIAEDASTLHLTVAINAVSSDPINVNYATTPITASEGGDYFAASGTATIPAGSTSATIPVSILEDNQHEGNETFSVTISSPVNAEISADTTLVTIADNDPPAPDPSTVIYPGNLDASFATGGSILDGPKQNGSDIIRDMAIDRQGRTITVGASYTGNSYKPIVMRLRSDGSVDKSFGDNGYTEPWQGHYTKNDDSFAVALQDDGKILVCGRISPGNNGKLVVARLEADGSLDTDFGSNGTFVYTSTSTSTSFGRDIIEHSDGIIYVLGNYTVNYDTDTILIALDQTGNPWTGFSGDGVHLLFGPDAYEVIGQTFELDSEGRFLVAGSLSDDFGIARVNADGSTDTSFDSDGFQRMSFSPETDYVADIGIDQAGRIVGLGPYDSSSGSTRRYYFGMFRLLPDGAMDTSFHYDGRAHPHLGTSNEEIPTSLKVLDSGRILASGYTVNGFGIIRMLNNGDLDLSFGSDGVATVGPADSIARSMHVDFDGSLLIAGHNASGNHDLVLARLTPNGFENTDWATDGYIQWDLMRTMGYAEWRGIHRDSQGRIYTAGYSNPSYRIAAAARFSANGQLDTSFAERGFDNYRYFVTKHYDAWDLTTDNSGKVYVCGTEQNSNYLFIRKLDSDGQLDTTFVSDGVHTFRPASGNYQEVFIERDSSGNLILATSAYVSGTLQTILAKITPAGAYETGFNSTGYYVSNFGNHHFVKGFQQLDDGKLLVCGHVHDGSNYKPFVARFLADGTPDGDFGNSGYAEFTSFSGAYTTEGLTLDSDGNLLLSGSVASYPGRSTAQAFLMKLSPSGVIDTDFGSGGMTVTNLPMGGTFSAAGMHALSDGRILIGGSGWASGTDGNFMMLRFLADGSLDTSFGLNGLAQADPVNGLNYNGYGDKLNAILAVDDSHILGVGGGDLSDGFFRPTLCRFLVRDLSFEDHMILAGIGGSDAASDADPNNDGIPNILSIAFGIDPLTGANRETRYPRAALSHDGVSGSLNFSIPAAPPANMICIIYKSGNLTNWTEIARRVGAGSWTSTTTVETTTTANGLNQISIECPPSPDCGFFRIEVMLDE